jgi:2-(1,2-epoxy-1,2-dihydrophenyl)acetyl-CoA isomerase
MSVGVTIRGPIAEVRLERGEYNAVDYAMVQQLDEALRQIAVRDDVQLVVLTGRGRSFCPGADLSTATEGSGTEGMHSGDYGATVLLHEMPQITVAAINGACAGAGLAWAAACDLRIASDRAQFNLAFLQVGVAGDMGGAWTIPRAIGGAFARELFLLTGKFDAAEALRVGLVSRVLPDDGFLPAAYELLEPLAHRPPAALRLTKANFLAAERMDLAHYVELETERHLALFRGAEGQRTRSLLAAQGQQVTSANT